MYNIEWYCKILPILSDIVKYLPILSNYFGIAGYTSQCLKILLDDANRIFYIVIYSLIPTDIGRRF